MAVLAGRRKLVGFGLWVGVRPLAWIGSACLLLACGAPADAPIDDPPAEPAEPARVDGPPPPGETARARCEAFRRDGLAVQAESRASFRGALGEPQVLDVETEPNRHMTQAVDTISVLRYEDIEARIRTAMGNDLLERVTVRGNRYLRYGEPAIGTTESRLIEVLGEPASREGDRLEYHCAPEPFPDQPTTVVLAAARIAEVVFDFYVD